MPPTSTRSSVVSKHSRRCALRPQYSALDLLDNQQLTTFPQVSSSLALHDVQFPQSSTAIVFVEDYFDFTTVMATQPRHPHDNNSSSSHMPGLSPFSTMRRGCVVKACLHCRKPLPDLSLANYCELVCKDCAALHQQSFLYLLPSSLHSNSKLQKTRSKLSPTSSVRSRRQARTWCMAVIRALRWRWRIRGLLPQSMSRTS